MQTRPDILEHAATLAERTRCRILQLLDHQELTVSELCSILQLPQSTASRHLKVLADGGWVVSRRDGTSHLYRPAADLTPAAGQLWELIRTQLADDAITAQDRQRLASVLQQRRTRSQEFFSSTANRWDLLRDELFGQRFDLVALLGLLDPSWVVGDLGCGTGRISEALAPFVRRVIAVDGSPAMLDAARQRLAPIDHVTVRQGELEKLPIETGQLDIATLFLALHHSPEPVRVLREARRVLAPGGRLLVVDMLPHEREEYRQQMGHLWLGFSRQQMTEYLTAAGFEDGRVHPLPADPEAKGPTAFAAVAQGSRLAAASAEPVRREAVAALS